MSDIHSLTIQPVPVPLSQEANGDVHVAGTRVHLESIICAFEEGAAAEEIVMRFPTLRLADVYAVIAYYLRHKVEVQDYMRWRDRKAEEVWQKIQAHQGDLGDIRARLLARKAEMERQAAQQGGG
jgi:uncharacterized protein (DUF433 family)